MTGFRRHALSRIVGADGGPFGAAEPVPVIADRPAARALAGAFAAAGAGMAFRIGGPGDVPEPGAGMFETLTSGSSGQSRRIRRSQASWIASFAVNARLFGIGPGVRVAVPGGLVQSLALYGAVEAVHLGAEVHLLEGLRPDRQLAALRKRRVEVLYAAPAQMRLMLEAGGEGSAALRLIVTGGSKLDPVTRGGLRALFPGVQVREFYGAAETSFITLSDEDTPEGSVGRPYPGVEVDLRGGEIWVRSPYLFQGYAGAPGGVWWDGGWVTVGEVGRIEGGHLFLSGRVGRMVTVADQNVFPEEVEAFLLTLPGVTRAAVLPRPDPLRGHVLHAVVAGGDAAALLAACRGALGPLAAPRRVHRVADWPMLASGKVDLAALGRMVG